MNGETTAQQQIAQAFEAWSTANKGSGGDGINFLPADASNPAWVTITTDSATSLPNGKVGPATTAANPGLIGPGNPATITFHPSMVNSSGNKILDPNVSGYGTVFLAVALHEIGHLQGIWDFTDASQWLPLTSNTSVMIDLIGVNNTKDTLPRTTPSTNDVTQAACTSAQIAANATTASATTSGGYYDTGDGYSDTSDSSDDTITGGFTDPDTGVYFDCTTTVVTSYIVNDDGTKTPLSSAVVTTWTFTQNGVTTTVTDTLPVAPGSSSGGSGGSGGGSGAGSGGSGSSGGSGGDSGGAGLGGWGFAWGNNHESCSIYWDPCWCN